MKKSQCATGGGVGDEPLNEMEERIVGLLNVESVEGIPGAFDIGVAPIHEVVVGVPFSLPLSGRFAQAWIKHYLSSLMVCLELCCHNIICSLACACHVCCFSWSN